MSRVWVMGGGQATLLAGCVCRYVYQKGQKSIY